VHASHVCSRLGDPAVRAVIAVLARGGPVMIPLAACSIMALAVILERALMWWRVGRSGDPDVVLMRAAKGEWTEAWKLGEASRCLPASDAALAYACPADHQLRAHAVRRWLDRLRPADFDDARGPD
jgi:biopolymer transport protein ExbB/TolQ